MARSSTPKPIVAPDPSRQVGFHDLLIAARQTVLKDALRAALLDVDPDEVKRELSAVAPRDALQILAGAGIRDEEVFPTPVVLKAKPTLVGYYRLLLGIPQKQFYAIAGMGPFKVVEAHGILSARTELLLPQFCGAMSKRLGELVRRISPTVTQRDIDELPLLVIGSQFQGARNNAIGRSATIGVFLAIKEIVADHIESETQQAILVSNASGRKVRIAQAADPDVRIEEEFEGEYRPKTAIEIKGGTDKSNAHNRAGEAEKSHQKAKGDGFRDFWTVSATTGLDMNVLRAESPTTNSWFDVVQVLGRDGKDWTDFRSRIAGEVGIPLGLG
jgi:XcyI restriction endonuclease